MQATKMNFTIEPITHDSVVIRVGKADPVQALIGNVLEDSVETRFGDDILMFWLEREASRERQNRGPTPRWFSPFSEGTQT
jgi:hypothetical protein